MIAGKSGQLAIDRDVSRLILRRKLQKLFRAANWIHTRDCIRVTHQDNSRHASSGMACSQHP